MNKRTYRAKNIKDIDWIKINSELSDEPLLFSIDIAKEKQFALLSNKIQSVSVLMYWSHPKQTSALLDQLRQLDCPLVAAMESTSTYGDAIRYQFQENGYDVYHVSAKKVHDAKEIYDGVPSLHDAKAAHLIARLYWEGQSTFWRKLSDQERTLETFRQEYELHQQQYVRNQNRLEAYLSRHWPEVTSLLSYDSVTLECLLIEYGSAQKIAKNKKHVIQQMQVWSKYQIKPDKIEKIVLSAVNTLGIPCTEAERNYFQALGKELKHSRLQLKQAKKSIELEIRSDPHLKSMRETIGCVSTAILLCCGLDPRNYANAKSYLKALGLNLKEKSSGTYKGPLKISKRGSGLARRFLYLATLRLIQRDSTVRTWYQRKVQGHAGQRKIKYVVAVMRKLSKALWHLGQGEYFDSNKLFVL